MRESAPLLQPLVQSKELIRRVFVPKLMDPDGGLESGVISPKSQGVCMGGETSAQTSQWAFRHRVDLSLSKMPTAQPSCQNFCEKHPSNLR